MGTRMPKEANIADCEICKNIPQEFSSEEKILKLLTVIEMKSYYDCCGTSITKLLKCPICSTYYYYNHYSEDSHYPHHFESDSLNFLKEFQTALKELCLPQLARSKKHLLKEGKFLNLRFQIRLT